MAQIPGLSIKASALCHGALRRAERESRIPSSHDALSTAFQFRGLGFRASCFVASTFQHGLVEQLGRHMRNLLESLSLSSTEGLSDHGLGPLARTLGLSRTQKLQSLMP